MMACLLDGWPMVVAIAACLLAIWYWGRNQRQAGRLDGRAEVYREQRRAREVRL